RTSEAPGAAVRARSRARSPSPQATAEAGADGSREMRSRRELVDRVRQCEMRDSVDESIDRLPIRNHADRQSGRPRVFRRTWPDRGEQRVIWDIGELLAHLLSN